MRHDICILGRQRRCQEQESPNNHASGASGMDGGSSLGVCSLSNPQRACTLHRREAPRRMVALYSCSQWRARSVSGLRVERAHSPGFTLAQRKLADAPSLPPRRLSMMF
jgi:hypothetical protein